MQTIRRLVIGCAACAVLVSAAPAQEFAKPGKEHAFLKRMEGTWDVVMEGGKGTMTYKMGIGGLWLLSEMKADFGTMKFEGRGMDTYDATIKKYRMIWADSMFTAPFLLEGTMDKDGKVLTMTGEGPGPEGKAKYKTVTEYKDADTVLFSLSMVDKNGKEQQMAKMTYKRKK